MRRSRSDEGATLVLALIIVLAVGLTIGTLLSLTQTGEITTVTYRGQASDVYSGGAGMDGAINALSNAPLATGTTASGPDCGGFSFDMPASAAGVNGKLVHVTCSPTSDSGTGGGPGGGGTTSANTPDYAVLTLPDTAAGEEGIHLASNTSTSLKVRGAVFTNGLISVNNNSTLFDCARANTACDTADGSVKAERDCDFNRISAGTVACQNTSPAISDPNASDPGATDTHYDLPSAADGFDPSQPSQSIPSCPASKVVIFQPGNYSDAAGLSSLMSGGCAGAAFYFSPGYYYFDFTNAGSHQWTIVDPNADVIGGKVEDTSATPTIWDPTAANARSTLPSPRQCAGNDTNLLANSGVQFIFGGDSQLYVNADESMDLCPIVDSSRQEISIYGVKSGSTPSSSNFTTATTATTNSGSPAFANVNNAKSINSQFADAELQSNNATAQLTISGWADDLPANAVVTSASIDVAQYTSRNSVSLTGSVSSNAGSQALTLTKSTSASNADNGLNIPVNLVNTAAKRGSLSFSFSVTQNGNQNVAAHFDGVTIHISYTSAGLHGESGCITATPYPATGCSLLSTSGNAANITIHGTIYAPKAAVDVQLPNQVAQFFGRGLVVRTLKINPTASNPLAEPTFDLPQASPGGPPTPPSPRKVVLTAYVDGVVRLRAFVKLSNAAGDANGNASVTVKHWSYVR